MNCLIIFSTLLVAQTQCRSLLGPAGAYESDKYWSLPQETEVKGNSILPLIALTNDYVPMDLATAGSESVERKTWDVSKDLKPFVMTQGHKLDKLLSEFVENTVNVNSYGTRPTQWLKQLKMIMKEFTDDVPLRRKNDEESKNKVVNSSSTTKSFQDIFNFDEDLAAYYQENEGNNKQIVSRQVHDGSHGLFSLMQEGKVSDNASPSDRNEVDRLDDMLVAAQHQLSQIRKYFNLICRKHHHREVPRPIAEDNDKHLEINEPQKLSVL